MKKIFSPDKRDYIIVGITLILGLFFGWLFFHGSKKEIKTAQSPLEQANTKKIIWTCAMHPQIRMDHPGKCPICGMDLIPLQSLSENDSTISPGEIRMTEEAIKIADIQTIIVKKAYPDKEVFLLGKVKPDERNIAELTARFGGRIEKLFVNFTGQEVSKGEKLAIIYSPALVIAQKELLEAEESRLTNPDLYNAARNKLKLWDLTDEQIDNIEKKGKTQSYFDVLSPIFGTVTRRNVALGDYVKEGSALFQVIDLTRIWIMFEAYESDLPWIRKGDKINFTVESLPGRNFEGRISFIDPVIDPKTRIAQVRVEIQNPGSLLKPDMFADGIVSSTFAGAKKDIMVPKTSVLWTGKRSVVWVKIPDMKQPTFKYREIGLGPAAGDFYVVNNGLNEGEEIATNGVFRIDAAAQLAGKPSMMNPEGGKTNTMPGMIMPGNSGSGTGQSSKNMDKPDTGAVSNSDNLNNKITGKSGKMNISMDFIMQLNSVYDQYIILKNAFVQSDETKAKQVANEVLQALSKTNMNLLKGDAMTTWMGLLPDLDSQLGQIASSDDLEVQRKAFSVFNDSFYKAIKTFGLMGKTVYYQFCPMFNNEKGAYWISETKAIRNPYFGESMLTCGETKETLKY